ncbi:MAG: acyl-CoA dehydrogenase family protein, partial [Planctomycetota bacterium]|nr:acyl-CoA dehydrogenase family protein [Planctomycetota bacterium]
TENLTHPEAFGLEAIEQAPYERRLVKRGAFLARGQTVLGATHHDPKTFSNCYTVLRPIYDRYLAEIARQHGVHLVCKTTVSSLIRENGRVIGVHTERGPAYADVVFLAEGDASHLVTQEGYENRETSDHPNRPAFLQGVKEILRIDPATIEQRFGVGPGEGAAYEFLIRNPTLDGKLLHLNLGVFLYTNRESLSVGYVLPLENLAKEYCGEHNRLIEWVKELPALKPLLEGSSSESYGTKVIRGGGFHEIPQMVDNGLAIGGAASGIGIDFPYPNFTGPATAMGLVFARAFDQIRSRGASFSRSDLETNYLQPVRQTHYHRNVEFLSEWPGYVERTTFFFDTQIDLICQAAEVLTDPKRSSLGRWWEFVRFLRHELPFSSWKEFAKQGHELGKIFQVNSLALQTMHPANWGHQLLNCLLLPIGGIPRKSPEISFTFRSQDSTPAPLPFWFRLFTNRLKPGLARAFSTIYANDDVTLKTKLKQSARHIGRRLSFLDLPIGIVMDCLWLISTGIQSIFDPPIQTPKTSLSSPTSPNPHPLDENPTPSGVGIETKLGFNHYFEGHTSHIKVFWPNDFKSRADLTRSPLFSVCPAQVYETEGAGRGLPEIVVNFDNCIKCESCWRSSSDVHWSRATQQNILYEAHSSALQDLDSYLARRSHFSPHSPRSTDRWNSLFQPQNNGEERDPEDLTPETIEHLQLLFRELQRFERRIVQFSGALESSPLVLENDSRHWLQELVLSQAQHADEIRSRFDNFPSNPLHSPATDLIKGLQNLSHESVSRAKNGAFFWVDSTGKQLRDHHLAGLYRWIECLLPDLSTNTQNTPPENTDATKTVALAEELANTFSLEKIKHLEEKAQGKNTLSSTEQHLLLTTSQHHGAALTVRALAHLDPGLSYPIVLHEASRHLGLKIGIEIPSRTIPVMDPDELVPLAQADHLLLLHADDCRLVPVAEIEHLPERTIGLRTSGWSKVTIPPEAGSHIKCPPGMDYAGELAIGSAPLFVGLVLGATEILAARSFDHAATRIQFPGQFTDEWGQDGISKFGAVKRMLSEIESHRQRLQALLDEEALFVLPPEETLRAQTMLALAQQSFGPHDGTVSYNAGQVLGGTAFSEDDIFARYYRDSSMTRYVPTPADRSTCLLARSILHNREHLRDRSRAIDSSHAIQDVMFQNFRGSLEQANKLLIKACTNPDSDPNTYSHDLAIGTAALSVAEARIRLHRAARLHETGIPFRREYEGLRLVFDRIESTVKHSLARASESGSIEHLGQSVATNGYPEPAQGAPLPFDYQMLVESSSRYESGDFLLRTTDSETPRYTPELLGGDPKLWDFHSQVDQEVTQEYYEQTFDGLPYGRFLEQQHQFPAADLDKMHERGYMRVVIPTEFGGQGLHKSYYYLIVLAMMRRGDPAMSLTLQVNTSIGTSPILLSLHGDLPATEKALRAFLAETNWIHKSIESLEQKNAHSTWTKVQETLRKQLGKNAALKQLGRPLSNLLKSAQKAFLDGDTTSRSQWVSEAQKALQDLPTLVQHRLDESARRLRAHGLALSLIARGHTSAFALTEPTAGSDSGGVKTLASLTKRRVHRDEDGVLFFFLDEPNRQERRNLVDANQVVCDPQNVLYRYDSKSDPTPLILDEYDYEADRVKTRYYQHHSRRIEFTDIAQIRTDSDGNDWYEFYELTGSKMWITNGRMMKIACLYAKSSEGETGFIVDRHAEGLIVGKDEEKLGQQGSPTNEIALDAVRVPRENILGTEGRGQVNALETLNVGRSGLATSSTAVLYDIVTRMRQSLEKCSKPSTHHFLGQVAIELAVAESISFELIGLFDRQATRALRMESAIGKFFNTESLHRGISAEEDWRGLEGTTHRFDIEKKRRDHRVLLIYEGTNEIQRFLILKDLIDLTWPQWEKLGIDSLSDAPSDLMRKRLFHAIQRTTSRFGRSTWTNVNFQSVFFRLSEMAAITKATDALAYRQIHLEESDKPRQEIARIASRMLEIEFDRTEELFERGMIHLEKDRYAPETSLAATVLSESPDHPPSSPASTPNRLETPLEIAVLCRPEPILAPSPRIRNGQLEEPIYALTPSEKRAILTAVRLRDGAGQESRIRLLACGDHRIEDALREGLSLGADTALCVDWPTAFPEPIDVSQTLASYLEGPKELPQIVLSGSTTSGTSPILALFAGRLKIPYQDEAHSIELLEEKGSPGLLLQGNGWKHQVPLPQAISIPANPDDPEGIKDQADLGQILKSAAQPIEHLAIKEDEKPSESQPFTLWIPRIPSQENDSDLAPSLSPSQVGQLLIETTQEFRTTENLDLPAVQAPTPLDSHLPGSRGTILFYTGPLFQSEISPTLIGPLRAAIELASGNQDAGTSHDLEILTLTSLEDQAHRELLSRLSLFGPRAIHTLYHPQAASFGFSDQQEALETFINRFRGNVVYWAGPEETSTLLAYLPQANGSTRSCPIALGVRESHSGPNSLDFLIPRFGESVDSKLSWSLPTNSHQQGRITFRNDATYSQELIPASSILTTTHLDLKPDSGNIGKHRAASRLPRPVGLSDAEFVIDIGYGVGTLDNLNRLLPSLENLFRETLGIKSLAVGGTRKVTQDLQLLPPHAQIGQTGCRINPRIVLALGVSGAPQHIDYIGSRALVLAFNKDPLAPLVQMAQGGSSFHVHAVVGDLFDTVPTMIHSIEHALQTDTAQTLS